MAISCDRSPGDASATPGGSARPVNPSTRVDATTQPVVRPPVVLMVDDQPREFPAARLVVEQRNGKTVALLMSDDPREAIDDDYTGNSYYLELAFEEQIDSLRDRVWEYQSLSAERVDSPNGLFLEGNRKQAQPVDVKIHFEGPRQGRDAVTWISGTFYLFEEAPEGARPPPPRLIPVAGRIPVPLP